MLPDQSLPKDPTGLEAFFTDVEHLLKLLARRFSLLGIRGLFVGAFAKAAAKPA